MLKKTIKKLKIRYGIKNKILLFFTVFTIIPLSIVGFVSYSKTTDTITSVLSNYIEQTTQTLNARVSTLFDEAITILNIASDYKIKMFLNATAEDKLYTAAKDMGSIYQNLRAVNKSTDNIMDVTIIGANGNCVSERNGYYRLEKDFYDYSITQTVLDSPRDVHIFEDPEIFHVYPGEMNVLSIVTSIFKNAGTNDVYGIIKVDVQKSALMDIFSSTRWSENSFITIVNSQGIPIFKDDSQEFSRFTQENIEHVMSQNQSNGNLTDTVDGQHYLIVYNTLQSTQWKILVAIPQEEILAPICDIRNITFIAILISLLLVFFINMIISNNIVRPITGLKKLMKQASSGDFDVVVEYNTKDEMAELYECFEIMVKKIKQLLKSLLEEHENLKTSEFKSLQAQINPHFLYNTLDSVVRVAESNKNKEVIDLTIALSRFYKAVLSSGFDVVPMRLELEHAKSYLKIMKMRYHDILDYEFNINSRVLNCKFPKIILQPIIENAIYHGIKNTLKAGKVKIIMDISNNGLLHVTISDNGIGMPKEELDALKRQINNDTQLIGESYGLKNVNQRIRLFFGKQYGLELESEENSGTKVYIIVPAIEL